MSDPSTPEPIDLADQQDETRASRRAERGVDGAAGSARSSRRRLFLLVAVVAVLVVVAVTLLLTQRSGQIEPLVVETTTVRLPPPTPAQDPIERDTSTALLAALPDAVLGYAVSEQTESAAMLDRSALEGWQLTYEAVDATVVLQVGQWPEAEEAAEAATAIVGDATATEQGEVRVGDAVVGTFTTLETDDVERTVWTNGTAVFVVEGAVGATRTFYDAFPF